MLLLVLFSPDFFLPPPTLYPLVTTCEYCGKPTDPSFQLCQHCGTALSPALPPPLPALSDPDVPPILLPPALPPILDAGRATKILLAFIAAQILAGIPAGVLVAATTNQDDYARLSAFGLAAILSLIAGGLVFWQMARKLGRAKLLDSAPDGACWVPGSPRHIAEGLIYGAVLGAAYLAVALALTSEDGEEAMGPLTSMAATPGLPQLQWFVLALVLAPPLEELLFRGLLFGGYNHSFGPVPAALLTTFIFVILHITEAIHFLPAFLFLGALGLGALWLRLRTSSIGPPIAFHFAYNATLGFAILLTTG